MSGALPVLAGLVLAVAHLPGSGDDRGADGTWYDVAAGDDGTVTVAAGRVPDASAAARLHGAVVELGNTGRSAAATLTCLDQAAHGIPVTVGSSAICLTLAPGGVLQWCAATHPPPLVCGPDGARRLEGDAGEPLGHPGRRTLAGAEERLPAGTTVVVGTDGARSAEGAADGPDPLAAVLARHHALPPDALAAALRAASTGPDGPPNAVGRTLLLVRVMPAPLEQRLPADPRRLSAVRRAVAAWSARAALSDDTTADLQLLLSEAVTNAVEHAYQGTDDVGEFVYSVRRRPDGGVRVEVRDFGRWRPPPDDPGYRGRGLAVIHNLAEEVSLDYSDRGTRIAFTVPSEAAPLAERPLSGVVQGWKPAGNDGSAG